MYLTIKVPLLATEEQIKVLETYGSVFHEEMERIIKKFEMENKIIHYPYRDVNDQISYYSKNQVIHCAEIYYEKRKKKPKAQYRNLFSFTGNSFVVKDDYVAMNFGKQFERSSIRISMYISEQQKKRIHEASKLLKLQVAKENARYYAMILISVSCTPSACLYIPRKMGVDIGMKCPAVCYTCDGKIKFIGNGREMKYHMRKLSGEFNKIDKKDSKKIKRYNHKLKKYKEHKDHEISKQIIEYALQENINIICLEKLTHLQHKFTNHKQMCWSYERLQTFISYKAKLAGIRVIFVKPDLTSKRCPKCNRINNVKSRHYFCRCGFHHHRDVVGAMNILKAPEI